jgi:ankyrin repeat protein
MDTEQILTQPITVQKVQAFFQVGGSANFRLEYNQPLLTCAVLTRDIALVKIIVNAGAEVNPVWDRIPIIYPSQNSGTLLPSVGHTAYIDNLFQSCGEDDNDYEREYDYIAEIEEPQKIQSPLVAAAVASDLSMVKLLLRSGAHPNLTRSAELWPIVIASHKGDLEIVQTLLNAGASASTKPLQPTALGVAAYKGHIEIVQALLKHGADPNIPTDEDGDTPLMRASLYGHFDVVKQLVEAGGDVNAWSRCGNNPLERAVAYGEQDIYNFLLPFADRNTRDLVVSEDIEQELERGKMDKKRELDKPVRKMIDLAFTNKPEKLKLLISEGVDVNAIGLGGDTALIAAARFSRIQIIQVLLEAGADPNLASEEYDGTIGYSPIMTTATDIHSNQCVCCVETLLNAGADVHQTTAEGVTVLMAALIGPNLPALKRFLDAGANVHLKNHEGKTVLDIALELGAQMSGFDEAIAILKAAQS